MLKNIYTLHSTAFIRNICCQFLFNPYNRAFFNCCSGILRFPTNLRLLVLCASSVHPLIMGRDFHTLQYSVHEQHLTSNNSPADLGSRGGPSCLGVSQHDSHPQQGQEGGSGELQACRSDLGTRGGYRADLF